MPPVVILNRNALGLCKTYRNYLGAIYADALEKGIEMDLVNDILARVFRKTMDCPNTWKTVYEVWNTSVQ